MLQYRILLPAFGATGREYVADIVRTEGEALARQAWLEYTCGVPCRIVAKPYGGRV